MENTKWDDLTPEQQEAFKKVLKDAQKRGALNGLKLGFVFILSNVFIVLVNAAYVQSTAFGFVSGLINGLMIFYMFKNILKEEHDRIQAEVAKILEK